MKAIVYHSYGGPDVLHVANVPAPDYGPDQIRIQVHYSTVTPGSVWLRKGAYDGSLFFTLIIRLMFGLFGPRRKITGFEFSGQVVGCGKQVSKFKVGDWVCGTTTGLKQGAYAQFLVVPEHWKQGIIIHQPQNLDLAEAAALPIGAMTASYFLTKAGLKSESKVLIYGAAGSVGSYAVQIAKAVGAHVTAVASARNHDLLKGLQADIVLDRKTWQPKTLTNQFDVVFDAVNKLDAALLRQLCKTRSGVVSVKQMYTESEAHLELSLKAIAEGKLKPVIDKTFSMHDIAVAHHYAESGLKRGNVVIEIDQD